MSVPWYLTLRPKDGGYIMVFVLESGSPGSLPLAFRLRMSPVGKADLRAKRDFEPCFGHQSTPSLRKIKRLLAHQLSIDDEGNASPGQSQAIELIRTKVDSLFDADA